MTLESRAPCFTYHNNDNDDNPIASMSRRIDTNAHEKATGA